MDPITTTLVILGVSIVLFLTNRIPLGAIALLVALSLWATQVLSLDAALAGFSDPTVLFIAALFVVSEALDSSGVTAWAANLVLSRGKTTHRSLLLVIVLLAAVFTALISVNGAVAALIPVVVVVAVKTDIQPGKLLMPLAFAAHAGSMLALTGTPVNIIVSDVAFAETGRHLGFFEFAIVGIPLVLGTGAIILLFSKSLLPSRPAKGLPMDLMTHARELKQQYRIETSSVIDAASGITEVVIPPRSQLVGLQVFPGMVSPSGDLVILSAARGGETLTGKKAVLRAGDCLLLQGSWDDLERHTSSDDVIAVNPTAVLRRGVPLGSGAKRALVIVAAMIVAISTGLLPPAVAGLLAALALLLTRVIKVNQVYESIGWTTVVLVAGMIPLSTAFTETGAADLVAEKLTGLLDGASLHVVLLVLCVVTMAMGQMISNTATVLIMIPVGLAVAHTYDASPLPFLLGLAVAGAAAFLTPIATPANLMVFEPGAYRFGDYWKLGSLLLVYFLAIAVLVVPLAWPFYP